MCVGRRLPAGVWRDPGEVQADSGGHADCGGVGHRPRATRPQKAQGPAAKGPSRRQSSLRRRALRQPHVSSTAWTVMGIRVSQYITFPLPDKHHRFYEAPTKFAHAPFVTLMSTLKITLICPLCLCVSQLSTRVQLQEKSLE